jgi:hypothetical protein
MLQGLSNPATFAIRTRRRIFRSGRAASAVALAAAAIGMTSAVLIAIFSR